jgi:hypothetical protein
LFKFLDVSLDDSNVNEFYNPRNKNISATVLRNSITNNTVPGANIPLFYYDISRVQDGLITNQSSNQVDLIIKAFRYNLSSRSYLLVAERMFLNKFNYSDPILFAKQLLGFAVDSSHTANDVGSVTKYLKSDFSLSTLYSSNLKDVFNDLSIIDQQYESKVALIELLNETIDNNIEGNSLLTQLLLRNKDLSDTNNNPLHLLLSKISFVKIAIDEQTKEFYLEYKINCVTEDEKSP